jgi:hypothetical protein
MKERLAKLPRYLVFLPLILFAILLYGGILQRFIPALSVGGTKYTSAQFNYWYYESYLNYVDEHYDELDALGLDTDRALDKQQREDGQTWEDYFRLQAEETLRQTEALLAQADEYGISLEAEDLPEYAQRLADADAECETSGIDLDDYVHSYYGYSVTAANYKKQLLRETGADAVRAAVTASLQPTQEEAAAYAAEHPELDDYSTADIRVIWFAAATDRFTGETGDTQLTDMQARAELLMERWAANGGDETAFADLAVRYSEHDSAADGGRLDSVCKGELPETLDSWLFDSARQSGDTTVSASADGLWVIYYCGADVSAAELSARQLLQDERVEAWLSEQEESIQVKELFGMQIAM